MLVLGNRGFWDGDWDAEGGALGAHLVSVLPDDEVPAGGRHDPLAWPRLEAGGCRLKGVRAPVRVDQARLLWGIVDWGALEIKNIIQNGLKALNIRVNLNPCPPTHVSFSNELILTAAFKVESSLKLERLLLLSLTAAFPLLREMTELGREKLIKIAL